MTVFAVNKSLDESMELTCDLRQFAGYEIKKHMVLHHDDVKAVNTEQNPNEVTLAENGVSSIENGVLTAVLPDKSFHMILLGKKQA